MPRDDSREGPARPDDIRLRGFADRVSVEEAMCWIDANARVLPSQDIDPGCADGRMLAEALTAPYAIPPVDRVAENGYALRAGETSGAGNYNPLLFRLDHPNHKVPPGAAAPVVSGAALPAGADAVLSYEAAQCVGAGLEIFGEAAPGQGVDRQGQQSAAGVVLLTAGRRLRGQDLGLLASLGSPAVVVVAQPRVALIVAGPKSSGGRPAHDADGPMLRGLIRRDGGIVSHAVHGAVTPAAMSEAMTGTPADVILVAGRTGTGADDIAPVALHEAGELSIHGIALRPGGSAGLGLLGDVPVVLLPGDPLACFSAYEILAGRLIRRLGGRDPTMPHPLRELEIARKIVSAVGLVDLCQVRCVDDRAEPVGAAGSGGLGSAVRADGFVIVPAPLEGYAPGARVTVHMYATN